MKEKPPGKGGFSISPKREDIKLPQKRHMNHTIIYASISTAFQSLPLTLAVPSVSTVLYTLLFST